MDEWVSIYEDMPQIRKGFARVSIDIDVIKKDGTIVENCFADVITEKFYNENGNRISKVEGWRTR